MDNAQLEAIIDRRVQARLATDRDYLFAEDAETQALAERKIELQEERAVLNAAPDGRHAERIADIDEELGELYVEIVYGVDRPNPCVHGHFDCATVEGGACANETLAKLQ